MLGLACDLQCFLLSMVDDSIDGIYETLKRCALISKTAGGIGLALHNIRAGGTYISVSTQAICRCLRFRSVFLTDCL